VARLTKPLLSDKSDEELMSVWVESRRAGQGETAAFDLLWERHHDATYGTVVRALGAHRSLAGEVNQEAWMEVTRSMNFQPGSFGSFIHTVAKRKALDRLSLASTHRMVPDRPMPGGDSFVSRQPARSEDPALKAQARQAVDIVREVTNRMPLEQRTAWWLRFVEELTFEEVASRMGTPIGTAKTRVRLALVFLADTLRERGIEAKDLMEPS